jgi:hypothetical protein
VQLISSFFTTLTVGCSAISVRTGLDIIAAHTAAGVHRQRLQVRCSTVHDLLVALPHVAYSKSVLRDHEPPWHCHRSASWRCSGSSSSLVACPFATNILAANYFHRQRLWSDIMPVSVRDGSRGLLQRARFRVSVCVSV